MASVALFGLTLVACSSGAPENGAASDVGETTPPASSATVMGVTEPTAPAHTDGGSTVIVKVTGSQSSALVNSLVVKNDGKESGIGMTQQMGD